MILSPHGGHRGWARLGKTRRGDQGRGIARLGMEQSGGLTPSAQNNKTMEVVSWVRRL